MEDKLLRRYRFLVQVAIIFAIMVLAILIPGSFMDESPREYSSFFSLAPNGISYQSLWQMLGASVAITTLQTIIFDSKLFKNLMTLYKTIIMLASTILIIIVFVIAFDWFPIDMPSAWFSFIGMFVVCFVVSTLVMVSKTKRESQTYDRLLNEYKERRGEESNE